MINCIVVDDEPKAIAILEMYIRKIDYLNLKGSFTDSVCALNFVEEENVDLIFLDINMPDLSGFEFISSMSVKPMTIFTTAYSEYAIEGYNIDAVDYLLKPILFSRFIRAVNKAKVLIQVKRNLPSNSESADMIGDRSETIYLKSGTDIHQVQLNDIFYVEGARNYLFVYTKEKKIMTLMRMKELEDQLPKKDFVRIHKSYIVAFRHIKLIEKHQITIHNRNIPIGRSYREMFHKALSRG